MQCIVTINKIVKINKFKKRHKKGNYNHRWGKTVKRADK